MTAQGDDVLWPDWLLRDDLAASDGVKVIDHLRRSYLTGAFSAQRDRSPERWDLAFERVLELARRTTDEFRYGPWDHLLQMMSVRTAVSRDDDDAARVRRRQVLVRWTSKLMTVVPDHVRSMRGSRTFEFMHELVGALSTAEDFAGAAGDTGVSAWLSILAERDARMQAIQLMYEGARLPWPAGRLLLFGKLDDPNDFVRAVAARAIGQRYGDLDEDPDAASFAEVVELIAGKELLRPGVAAPLLWAMFAGDLHVFEHRGRVVVREWIDGILARRTAPEPNLLPVCIPLQDQADDLFGD